jgi:hypothetical protein
MKVFYINAFLGINVDFFVFNLTHVKLFIILENITTLKW